MKAIKTIIRQLREIFGTEGREARFAGIESRLAEHEDSLAFHRESLRTIGTLNGEDEKHLERVEARLEQVAEATGNGRPA